MPPERHVERGLLGLVVIIVLYLALTTIIYDESLPILSRPGGLVSLPILELQNRTLPHNQLAPSNHLYLTPASTYQEKELYGYVTEEQLPWFFDYPKRLVELRQELDAYHLVIAFRTILPDPLFGEEENIAIAANYLAGTVVSPGEIVSVNRIIGPYTTKRGYGEGPTYIGTRIVGSIAGGVCKIASTLYNVVVGADLQIIERHPHSMLVPYVPPGRDATVAWGTKDLRFKNNKDTPIVLWAESTGGILYIAMYGQFTPPQVRWCHKELHRQPAWTIKQTNPHLPKGATRRIEGADGVSVQTWIQITYPGRLSDRRPLGTDYYRPMPHIIEVGP